jgi:hypothetical protein
MPEMQGGLLAIVVLAGGALCSLVILAFLAAVYRVALQRMRKPRLAAPPRPLRMPAAKPQIPLRRAA